MRIRSLAAVCATLAMATASLVVLSGTASASPSKLYVAPGGANGGNSCQSSAHPCQTIGFALSLANAGAKIYLAAGTYNEQITITKPVTITGAGSGSSIIKPSAVPLSDTDTDSTYPQFYVVDVKNTSGVTLKGVGINGSAATPTFDNDGYACGQDYVGIYFHDASGTLTSDSVTGINLPPDLFGCQGGQGIYVTTDHGSASPSNVTMTSLSVNNYDKNGITCDDPATVCTIDTSTIVGIGSTPLIAQNGIQIWASSGTLSGNTITGNTYDGPDYAASGILIGDPYVLSVAKNNLSGNDSNIYLLQVQGPDYVYCGDTSYTCTDPGKSGTTFSFSDNVTSYATNVYPNPIGTGYGDGLDLDSVTTAASLDGNTSSSDPGNGISLYGTTSVAVEKNTLSSDGNGIYLGSGTASATATDNNLTSNKVSGSAIDGILADTTTVGNLLKRNTVSSSGDVDARDNSTGSGTRGTANTWTADACSTSDPVGLCNTRAVARAAAAGNAAVPTVNHPLVKPTR